MDLGATSIAADESPIGNVDHLHPPDQSATSAISREARGALALAATLRTASILLDQWAGALAREVREVQHLLASSVAEAAKRLEVLLGRAPLGLHLTQPWRVVLAGRPNVGKSSLINALLGYQRSIAFDQPGTTRDVVTASAALDGWPVELTDTAGLRAADESNADDLESAGIAKALGEIAAADVIVLVFDATQPFSEQDEALCRRWAQAVLVANKCDLPDRMSLGAGGPSPILRTSALRGEGIQPLASRIARELVPDAAPPGAGVPFTARQVQFIRQALAAAQDGDAAASRELLVELLGE
jgi:tRNA modification GTPase